MSAIISTVLSGLGGAVKGFFGFKESQARVVEAGLNVIADANSSNAEREAAIAQIITAESKSSYWMAAVWRPLTMLVFLGLIVAFFFGYTPPNINEPMSPMMEEIFNLMKIGIGGYIPARTIDKIVKEISIGKTLRAFIEKKMS